MGTRILKAHVDAAMEAIDLAMAAFRVSGRRAFAEIMAEAVVSATDGKKSYAVVVREGATLWVFGPYLSAGAASKAMERGLVGTSPDATGWVTSLIPAPKLRYAGKAGRKWSEDE